MTAPPSCTVRHGDALQVLRLLPPDCLDACVTDPPYGLAFMGKHWDKDVPPPELWTEVLRVLKPGAHLLAFAGTRTVHRMGTAIEEAGFQIRDMIAWVYASGFPKSLDVSDAVQNFQEGRPLAAEKLRRIYTVTAFLKAARDRKGWNNTQIDALFGTHGMAGHWTSGASQPAVPSLRQWAMLKDALGFDDSVDSLVQELASTERPEDWGEREQEGGFLRFQKNGNGEHEGVGGFGTALKPAVEPVIMARKAPQGTMAQNIQTFGTGALSIDACRIPGGASPSAAMRGGKVPGRSDDASAYHTSTTLADPRAGELLGRFPANLVHDGSQEVLEVFPDAGGGNGSRQELGRRPDAGAKTGSPKGDPRPNAPTYGDSGSAARLFFCAKPSTKERRNTTHPTVKPVALLRYLVRLVTLPGQTVLDPFAGTGTTGEAALAEGRSAFLIDKEAAYVQDMRHRLQGAQLGLFHGQENDPEDQSGAECPESRCSQESQADAETEPKTASFEGEKKEAASKAAPVLELRDGATLSDKAEGARQGDHAERVEQAEAERLKGSKTSKAF